MSFLIVLFLPAVAQDLKPLSNGDVIDMSKASLSTGIVIAKIRRSKCEFDTSPAGLVELKANGVSDEVVEAMIDWKPYKEASPAEDKSPKNEETGTKSTELIAAEKVITALRRLDNAIAVGVTFQNYSSLLIENKTMVDENLKNVSDSEFRFSVDQALTDHQYAMSVWNLAVANGWSVFFTKQEPGRTLITRYRVPIKISIWTQVPVMTGLNYVWLSARSHFNNGANRLHKMDAIPVGDPAAKP
jgi:hypothetical protein